MRCSSGPAWWGESWGRKGAVTGLLCLRNQHPRDIPSVPPLPWSWVGSFLSTVMEEMYHLVESLKKKLVVFSELPGEWRAQRSSSMIYSTWKKECHIERGQWHLLEATHGQNGPNASPGGGAWDFSFLEGTELGRGIIKFMLEKQLRKSDPPDSFFPSSPFLRTGRVLKRQNCLPWSKRITSDKSGLPCDLCANNNTEHVLSTNICHTLKCALCMDCLIYLHSSSFKYYHSHLMWRTWGQRRKSLLVASLVWSRTRTQRLFSPVPELVLLWVMPDCLHSTIFTIINTSESFVTKIKKEPLVWDQKNKQDIIYSFAPYNTRGSLAPSFSFCLPYLPS